MQKPWWLGAAALAFITTSAIAADSGQTNSGNSPVRAAQMAEHSPGGREWSLGEARQRAHERAARLDKMTPQEWAQHEQRRRERIEKWKTMTPAQREEAKARHRAWLDAHPHGYDGSHMGDHMDHPGSPAVNNTTH